MATRRSPRLCHSVSTNSGGAAVAVGHGHNDAGAHEIGPQRRLVLLVRHLILLQQHKIDVAVELAVGAAEGRIFDDRRAHGIVVDGKAQSLCFEIEQVLVDDLVERGVDQTQFLDLIFGQAGVHRLTEALDLAA